MPTDARILEIGCGVGMLWRDNRARIPVTWQLTLSDFSLGMIQACATHLPSATYLQADAQAIPFGDKYFDAVFANHMLYHVPDVSRAIAEIRRVLKANGKFYAATNGDAHLRELKTIVAELLGHAIMPLVDANVSKQFSLENGAQQLAKSFVHVEHFDFDDALVVTEVEPLVAYIMSGFMGKQLLHIEYEESLRQFIADRMARDGAIRITKSTGLFIATN
ncbi:MAG: class I SAM-dependent methyltransferase [Chloroflexi bacterium]|nr:class I SAM-dependent methyltransferase [Chloroflexota bacterium]